MAPAMAKAASLTRPGRMPMASAAAWLPPTANMCLPSLRCCSSTWKPTASRTNQRKFIGTMPMLPPNVDWKALSGSKPIEVAPCASSVMPRQNSMAPSVTMKDGIANSDRDQPVDEADGGAQGDRDHEADPGGNCVVIEQRGGDDRAEGVDRADRQVVLAGDHQETHPERDEAHRRDRLERHRDVGAGEVAELVREQQARRRTQKNSMARNAIRMLPPGIARSLCSRDIGPSGRLGAAFAAAPASSA